MVVIDGAEWTGNGADFATDAYIVEYDFCAGFSIDFDRFDRTRMQAPGLCALGAGIRHLTAIVVEFKHFDTRFSGNEHALVLVGAGHFALQAAGAFGRIDRQRLKHRKISSPSMIILVYELLHDYRTTLPSPTELGLQQGYSTKNRPSNTIYKVIYHHVYIDFLGVF
jgi:hypothetical protein